MKWGEHKAVAENNAKSSRANPNVDVLREISARGINVKKVKQKEQKKHFKGSDYVKGKSYFTVKPEEVEQIVQENIGKGYGLTNRKGEWVNKENIDCGKIIGYNVKPDGTEEPTRFADIHYSKDGYHLVPTYDKRGK